MQESENGNHIPGGVEPDRTSVPAPEAATARGVETNPGPASGPDAGEGDPPARSDTEPNVTAQG
jgi:hypothetical protein